MLGLIIIINHLIISVEQGVWGALSLKQTRGSRQRSHTRKIKVVWGGNSTFKEPHNKHMHFTLSAVCF